MNRRTFLTTGSLAVTGLGLGGCATLGPARGGSRRVNLALVDASWDRVIRTTVGLRPHRDSGFVLKAEKLDAKTVIHNYGHGGAGMSLTWGTGYMAAELALQHDERRVAVIGCGAAGLTAARQLQRRGFDVTIYAMSVPPDTTSNMSLAGFTPTSGLVEDDRRTPEWDAQFRRAAEIAYRQLQLLAGPNYGVSWIHNYSPTDQLRGPGEGGGGNDLLPSHLRTGQVILQPGEHPFPTRYAIQRSTMRIEPSIYLDALVRDFLLFGGHIVIRKFDSPADLMSLSESLIINCTGLGSHGLFGDHELVPLKGQLTHLVPQAEVDYQTSSGGGGGGQAQGGQAAPQGAQAQAAQGGGGIGIHMMPRRDGLALGGTSERGVWTLEPNEEARQRIVAAQIRLFSAMRPPDRSVALTTAAAPAAVPSLESFYGLEY